MLVIVEPNTRVNARVCIRTLRLSAELSENAISTAYNAIRSIVVLLRHDTGTPHLCFFTSSSQ